MTGAGRLSTGVAGLDAMIDGAFLPGDATLVTGSPATDHDRKFRQFRMTDRDIVVAGFEDIEASRRGATGGRSSGASRAHLMPSLTLIIGATPLIVSTAVLLRRPPRRPTLANQPPGFVRPSLAAEPLHPRRQNDR